ncbi:hypothetical protein KCV01_g6654, partial [Aureobasidium melanogenum]
MVINRRHAIAERAEHRAQAVSMRQHRHAVIRQRLHIIERGQHAGGDLVQGFAAIGGHGRVDPTQYRDPAGVFGHRIGDRPPLQITEGAFHKALVEAHRATDEARRDLRRAPRTRERRADDMFHAQALQAASQRLGLFQPDGRQRAVRPALRATGDIPFRLAMAGEDQLFEHGAILGDIRVIVAAAA